MRPTFDNFVYWYKKYKAKECTKDHARQMVGFHYTRWYYLCRDYDNGEDVSKYFNGEERDYGKDRTHNYQ